MSIASFHKKIFTWYKQNKRSLPWRKTKDPYNILISEVMLQQTQVDRVIPYYEKWLQSFPDFKTLAKSSNEEILKHWSGLGYNNRALRLKKLANVVIEKYKGNIPKEITEKDFISLPGIGPYTANAVLAFAFNKDVVVIDTNIRRIFIHEFNLPEDISKDDLYQKVKAAIPKRKCRVWYNALMDYGATHLTSKKTGIKPTTKQSPFKGSNREVRGYIMKELTKKKTIFLADVQSTFPNKDVDIILKKMIRDELIVLKENKIRYKN